MLQTHFPHSPRWLPVWEGIAGGKEGRPWPLRKAHAVCISLLPSSPQPISLSPVSPASISSPHWAPAPKLSSLAPCPQTKKHPQTHPWAKKHLPGSLRDANGWVPSLEGDLWKGPGPILQDGGVLSAEGAATSVSPRHINHRSGRLDRHSWSLSEKLNIGASDRDDKYTYPSSSVTKRRAISLPTDSPDQPRACLFPQHSFRGLICISDTPTLPQVSSIY